MADESVKKFTVPLSDLPSISSENEGYSLRYRFISADRNRNSHWSPLFLISPDFTYVPGSISFNKAGSIAQIVWDAVEITKVTDDATYPISKALEYDVWVRWDRGGSKTATITNISASSGTITYTASNSFSFGDVVRIVGVTPSSYNLNNVDVFAASASSFTVLNSATGTYISGGEASTESGDWLYKERIQTTSLSLPIPSTWTIDGVIQGTAPNRLSIEIYLKGYPIERSNGPAGTPFLKVYRLLNETV